MITFLDNSTLKVIYLFLSLLFLILKELVGSRHDIVQYFLTSPFWKNIFICEIIFSSVRGTGRKEQLVPNLSAWTEVHSLHTPHL